MQTHAAAVPARLLLLLPLRREKNSEKVDRLVQFTGTSKIAALSPYLTVQMMRFFFKRTPDGGQKAKILRKVGLPG
jgi:ubiquitin carboxyl-terminal hydrolase 14